MKMYERGGGWACAMRRRAQLRHRLCPHSPPSSGCRRRSLIDLLIRIECKNETDDMFEKGKPIERFGLTRKWPQRGPTPAQDASHAQATLMQYRGVMLVSPRDFVAASAWKVLEDGTLLVVAYSEPHAGMPEQKGVVRAQLHIGGWVVKPSGGVAGEAAGGCDCTYLMLADLKGTVPDWLTKQVFSTQGAVVTKLKAALDKRFKGEAGAKALADDKALPLVNLEEEEAAAA